LGQLDLVGPDEEVPPVALEKRSAAPGPDPIRDERARRVPQRRHDDDHPEAPRAVAERLDLRGIRNEETGEWEDELGREWDHRRLDGHGDEQAEIAESAVDVRQERDDDRV